MPQTSALPGLPLRFRQVHLDFHTSPAIEGIGAAFDPEEFADTLEKARVNSVTCFARCHHGYLYFASEAHPERIHPHLARPNLLAEQIDACHRRNIRVPIYITVQWDEFSADRHREWLCLDENGAEYGTKPLDAGFYRNLDVFHPGYRQFLFDHTCEVLTTLPTDGLFFDIVSPKPSLALHWIEAMDRAGRNPADADERMRFAQKVLNEWMEEMTAFVRTLNSDCTIFYNAGHIGPKHRVIKDAYTHFELESLPSGGWGYLHFPQAARYSRTLGHDFLGMTGKFHTSWGDFGSFKNEAALQFECFHALALNGRISVGDQLPPSGKLDAATYDLIGSVYREVERKEPYCTGATAVVDVALVTSESPEYHPHSDRHLNNVLGAIRMLQELHVQFDIVDNAADFSKYRLLILPDDVIGADLPEKIAAYLAGGGSVIASCRSCEGAAFLGVEAQGEAPYSPDFFVPTETIGRGLPEVGHVMYLRGRQVMPMPGTETLASTEIPYFNRTWRNFCSHAHTPSSGKAGYPAATRAGNVVYLAHPVFRQYHERAPRWVKTMVADAIRLLLPDPVLEVDGPSSLIATVNYQATEDRYPVHLLHYVPERRGQQFDIIEDVLPVYGVDVRLRLPKTPTTVTIVPEGELVPFAVADGVIAFTLPKLVGHAILLVE
ncbi:MAG: alpha-amylase family protein [Capsulimonadales bacterium]|nr:alpha-amylase family protein [Capsulimonadales bacterium]